MKISRIEDSQRPGNVASYLSMERMRLSFLTLAAAAAVAACGGDTGTNPGGGGSTPTTTYAIVFDSATKALVDSVRPVGSVLEVHAHVTNSGASAAGASVQWGVSAGGGSVSPSTTTTDASGNTTVFWTFGTISGGQSLAAVSNGTNATLVAGASAGPPGSLTRVTPDSLTTIAGSSVLLTVRALDQFSNPATTAVVTWAASSGTLSTTSATSSSTGNVDVAFTTPATPGTYFVTATLANKGTITFKIIAI